MNKSCFYQCFYPGFRALHSRLLQVLKECRVQEVNSGMQYFFAYDFQESVLLQIYQGESPIASDNILLGDLTIKVPRAKEGEEKGDALKHPDTEPSPAPGLEGGQPSPA